MTDSANRIERARALVAAWRNVPTATRIAMGGVLASRDAFEEAKRILADAQPAQNGLTQDQASEPCGAWVRMNGSVGCLPDSIDAHETEEAAIETAILLFDDIPEQSLTEMTTDLKSCGIHYFNTDDDAGADYVSVEYDATISPDEYED